MNNSEKNKEIKGGLVGAPEDPRDFSLTTVFGAMPLEDLPDGNFSVGEPLEIKDQGNSDLCTAFALCAVSEDQEMVQLSPEYTFFKTKQIQGGDPMSYGADLRSACKSAVKVGFLESQYNPFLTEGWNRESVVDPENYDDELDMLAWDHSKASYFKVDGPYDTFDNIRVAMYNYRAEGRSVFTGCYWRKKWTGAEGGIIPNSLNASDIQIGNYFGHAFKIFGWKYINNEPYLVAQLSNGIDIGDNGIFYFSREVVNREFTFGAFTFRDMPKGQADYHNYNKISVDTNWIVAIFKVLGRVLLDFLTPNK